VIPSRLALAFLCLLAACHTVTPLEPLTPSQGLKGYPQKIEVTHRNGSKETLRSPNVIGDSLIGYKPVSGTRDSLRVAYPISDIRSAGEREFSGARTVGAIAAFTLAAGIVFFITASIAISNSVSHKS
jgi:hypothetical protein